MATHAFTGPADTTGRWRRGGYFADIDDEWPDGTPTSVTSNELSTVLRTFQESFEEAIDSMSTGGTILQHEASPPRDG